MRPIACTKVQSTEAGGFDLARLSKSKDTVDLCPNTIRACAKRGLPLYRQSKVVFFSKAELERFIRAGATVSRGAAVPVKVRL